MSADNGVTRREFVSTATGAAVGTGVRGIGMWGTPIARRYADTVEFVGSPISIPSTVDGFHSDYIVKALARGVESRPKSPWSSTRSSARRCSTPRSVPARRSSSPSITATRRSTSRSKSC